MTDTTVNIVIVGGGFAGVECARVLSRQQHYAITLISPQDHMEYYPGVFRSFGTRQTQFSKLPLSDLLPSNCRHILDRVTAVDITTKTVTLSNGDTLTADKLVLCPGMVVSHFNIPGAQDATLSFRTTDESLAITSHIDQLFESHRASPVDEQLVAFRFVVIGAGPAGCEIAAGIAQYTKTLAVKYAIDPHLISVELIEGRDRVLPLLDQRVSRAVTDRLASLGVHCMMFRRFTRGHMWTAELSDVTLGARTIIWSAGIAVPEFLSALPGVQYNPKGRLSVNEYCELVGHSGVYAIGDISDTPASGLAQTAIHDGAFVAGDIMCHSRACLRPVYRAPDTSVIVPLGHRYGVVQVGPFVLSGYIGWIARGIADTLYYLPRLPLRATWRRVAGGLF